MGRFLFELSDERREKLEQHRVAWGLRSLSAAVQHLIDNHSDMPFSPEEMGAIFQEIRERAPVNPKIVVEPKEATALRPRPKSEWALVKEAQLAFRPHPKPGKGK